MYIQSLTLNNFRNYAHLELSLPGQMVVLQGDNAQGKTNLLEAIYLLAATRSPLAATEREFLRWQSWQEDIPVARLVARVQRASDRLQLELAFRGEPRSDGPQSGLVYKQIKMNGLARRASDVVGLVNVVLFTARDIEIVGGAPSLRRRYMDLVLCQADSRYLRALQDYGKVLDQRNPLLKRIQEGESRPDELHFWDNELVDKGSYVCLARRQLVAHLNLLVAKIHPQLAPGETLELVYRPSLNSGVEQDFEQLKAAFQLALAGIQKREIGAGTSLVGPHRDDLQFLNGDTDLGVYASRGQQRTVSLSLRLAEAGYLKEKKGDSPVLLLDDVLSELDPQRRGRLLTWLADYEQVLLTTAEFDLLPADLLSRATRLQVRQGAITPVA